jgi:hypothetical protein
MCFIVHGKLAPNAPSQGFFTSIMSAPPSMAAMASASVAQLTSNFTYDSPVFVGFVSWRGHMKRNRYGF